VTRRCGIPRGFGRPPAKGTQARQVLLLALRPQGVTAWEARQAGVTTKQSFGCLLDQFLDQKGYDVRSFPLPNDQRTLERVGPSAVKSKKPPRVWRLVGKLRWNGTYRSFIRP
jgi:hypothetical protein